MRLHGSALAAGSAAIIVLSVLTVGLLGQNRGGRPVAPGGPPVDSTWAALTFELKVSNSTLERLRPHFEAAWREQTRSLRESVGNSQELAERTQKIRDNLDAVLKTTLTAQEARTLAEWRSSRPPIGPPPDAPPGGPRMGGPGGGGYRQTAHPPLASDDAEKRILEAAAQVTHFESVPLEDARVIRLLAEAIGAKHAVEIGTSTGYSGLWLALALQRTGGKLTTLEIDSSRAAIARENFRKAGVEKLVTVIVGDAHKTLERLTGPIDMVFIDADKERYADYLEKTLPLLRPGGLILAHNVDRAEVAERYVSRITGNPHLETVFYTDGRGLSITLKKR